MREIFTRDNGSRYIFDSEEWGYFEGSIQEALSILREVPSLLASFDDTKEKSNEPKYISGVLSEGFSYIKREREIRLRKAVEKIPFSREAVERMIEETLSTIPEEIEKGLADITKRKNYIDKENKLRPEALKVSKNESGEIEITIPECLWESFRKDRERDIPEACFLDLDKFRKALSLLWEISDHGGQIGEKYGLDYKGDLQIAPSIVSRLLSIPEVEEREKSLNTVGLLEELFNL